MSFLKFLCLCVFLWNIPALHAQQKITIHGLVSDAKTNEALPFVAVSIDGSTQAVNTDEFGKYTLLLDSGLAAAKLKVFYVGYKAAYKEIQTNASLVINFKLYREEKTLDEITVRGRKNRYRNKNNPAVELIRKVIDNKEKNRPENYDYYQVEKYEKVQFALSNVSDDFKNKKVLKNFQFMFENMDSTKLKGAKVLPIYLKETVADVYERRKPKAEKEIIKATKSIKFGTLFNGDGISQYLDKLYQHVNIYDNNIFVLTQQFLSPIAPTAPVFYKFFIVDTTEVNGSKLIQLGFVPRNHTDMLFQGNMYITLEDSSYAVKKIEMTVNKDINLNFVKQMEIEQEFTRDISKKYPVTKDVIRSDFGAKSFDKSMGIYGERTTTYRNIQINIPQKDSVYKGYGFEQNEDANKKNDAYWDTIRHEKLSQTELKIYQNADSIQKVPLFKQVTTWMTLLLFGYKSFGLAEIGPVNTFYSFNPVEGFRLRFGGRTTTLFSNRMMLESYVAYGFKDRRWKGYIGATYSLTKRNIFQFPVKSLKVSFQRDTKIPGQELQFVNEDNVLLSFKRGINNKWLYNRYFNLIFLNEFKNHFSYTVAYKYWQQEPAGGLHFNCINYNDKTSNIKNLTTSELSLQLRWAPREQFYQGKQYRTPINNQFPVFTFIYTQGIKGLFGSSYNYENLRLNIYKRFYLSQLGYSDVVFDAGYLVGQVPYPLLDIHHANQTYSYQLQSYNLMNFLEFVSDHYASILIDHHFNGLLFNKMPLFKKLKWREVASCKILYGGVRNENNPAHNSDLYRFPIEPNGTPITYVFNQGPYVEASVGIANIFKFLRVDVVKRFSYLDHPNVSSFGIRARVSFEF
ncbi:MAG: carboxypeptidase-like regulatory domain-containing protein [Bacteroidetes bacterium]|nr:carboxypeptidase-like regulatory domain-containing protein [Bacteroidota bacterium]